MANSANPNRSHRGEAVVHDVLAAAREELAKVGFRALRIEDVAARANVARTTIYRRWPTKGALVRETLQTLFEAPHPLPDTGSLRDDLRAVGRAMVAFLTSPNGAVLTRLLLSEGAEPELRDILDGLRKEKDLLIARIFQAARDRGELRPGLACEMLVSTFIGGMHHRLVAIRTDPAAIDVDEHVDLFLLGPLAR